MTNYAVYIHDVVVAGPFEDEKQAKERRDEIATNNPLVSGYEVDEV